MDDQSLSRIVDLLNQALFVEYSIIVHIPRIAPRVKNEEIRNLVIRLGQDSTRHADVVGRAVAALGGVPSWNFEPLDHDQSLEQFFRRQLEKERLALLIHSEAASLAKDRTMKAELEGIAADEQRHVEAVERILAWLRTTSE